MGSLRHISYAILQNVYEATAVTMETLRKSSQKTSSRDWRNYNQQLCTTSELEREPSLELALTPRNMR
jgi:hypothetical protein